MNRRTEKLLWDCLHFGEDVILMTKGKTHEDFKKDMALRYGVKHAIMLMGETLSVIRKEEPREIEDLPETPQIIGLRNRIVHRYDDINDELIWQTTQKYVPPFVEKLKTFLL